MSVVYLLHFDRPLSRGMSPAGTELKARHYIGFAKKLGERLQDHVEGHGARLTQVCIQRGIKFACVRVWNDADRHFERRLKNSKQGPRLCPICNPKAMNLMKMESAS